MNLNRSEELVITKNTDKIIDETKTGPQRKSNDKLKPARGSFSIRTPSELGEAKRTT